MNKFHGYPGCFTRIVLGALIAIILIIITLACLTEPTVSQEKVKKISIQQARSPEFRLSKVTNIIFHYEYTADSTNIKMVVDSLYIMNSK